MARHTGNLTAAYTYAERGAAAAPAGLVRAQLHAWALLPTLAQQGSDREAAAALDVALTELEADPGGQAPGRFGFDEPELALHQAEAPPRSLCLNPGRGTSSGGDRNPDTRVTRHHFWGSKSLAVQTRLARRKRHPFMLKAFVAVLICGGVAVLLFRAALKDGAAARKLRRHGIHTRGVVVDNVPVEERNSGANVAPIIAFADRQGCRVEFTTRIRGVGMGLATGREVPVVYLAHEPQSARVFTRRHMLGPALGMAFVASGFLCAGVVIAVL
ncbi:DUF3592 domain-containing protein [Streptomyces sp. NPDC002588]|uniref:DUF3592 domain-containing protein n=1 Tax=Streptomyces sp. NPDC002588 TaxID=3154419 RepID=UPI00331860A6